MGGVPLIDTNRELIEREQECAVLDALVDRLRDGGGTVVVRGEAGIGKSVLLQRVRGRGGGAGCPYPGHRRGRIRSIDSFCGPAPTPAPGHRSFGAATRVSAASPRGRTRFGRRPHAGSVPCCGRGLSAHLRRG